MNGSSKMVSAQNMQAANLMITVRDAIASGIDRTAKALARCTTTLERATTLDTSAGWLRFVSDSDRRYDGLSVKVLTSVFLAGETARDDFQADIACQSTGGADYIVSVVPTVTRTRFYCPSCTDEILTALIQSGKQYTANACAVASTCQRGDCGAVVVAGAGALVTVTYHLLNGSKVPRQTATHDFGEGNDLNVRGYLGSQYEVTPAQIVTAIQTYRAEYISGNLPLLAPVKAQTQHNGKVKTAYAWNRDGLTGQTVKRDKVTVTALSL
jgi:hypothetical protein